MVNQERYIPVSPRHRVPYKLTKFPPQITPSQWKKRGGLREIITYSEYLKRVRKVDSWLTSSLITLFVQKAAAEAKTDIHFVNDWEVLRIFDDNFKVNLKQLPKRQNGKQWTATHANVNEIIFTVVRHSHWYLAHVNFGKKFVQVYDSLLGGSREIVKGIFQFVMKAFPHRCPQSDHQNWNLVHDQMNVPQQKNSYDCGVYVIAFAESIFNGWSFDWITPGVIRSMRFFFAEHIASLLPAAKESKAVTNEDNNNGDDEIIILSQTNGHGMSDTEEDYKEALTRGLGARPVSLTTGHAAGTDTRETKQPNSTNVPTKQSKRTRAIRAPVIVDEEDGEKRRNWKERRNSVCIEQEEDHLRRATDALPDFNIPEQTFRFGSLYFAVEENKENADLETEEEKKDGADFNRDNARAVMEALFKKIQPEEPIPCTFCKRLFWSHQIWRAHEDCVTGCKGTKSIFNKLVPSYFVITKRVYCFLVRTRRRLESNGVQLPLDMLQVDARPMPCIGRKTIFQHEGLTSFMLGENKFLSKVDSFHGLYKKSLVLWRRQTLNCQSVEELYQDLCNFPFFPSIPFVKTSGWPKELYADHQYCTVIDRHRNHPMGVTWKNKVFSILDRYREEGDSDKICNDVFALMVQLRKKGEDTMLVDYDGNSTNKKRLTRTAKRKRRWAGGLGGDK